LVISSFKKCAPQRVKESHNSCKTTFSAESKKVHCVTLSSVSLNRKCPDEEKERERERKERERGEEKVE